MPSDLTQPDLLSTQNTTSDEDSKTLEALLFASEAVLTEKQIKTMLAWTDEVYENASAVLESRLSQSALELVETASGLRLQIRSQHAPLIQNLWPDKQTKLSQALLETLSIIAYKQPVTRADIEQIRGVSTSSAILRQLFDKNWITEKGFRDLPGKPALLHTTKFFLDAFNLKHLKDLPELPELKDISELENSG